MGPGPIFTLARCSGRSDRSDPALGGPRQAVANGQPQSGRRAGGRENACAKRVFLATLDARLIALDFATGQRCADFGTRGEVNLLDGIEHLVDDWEFNVTSPPTVVGNVAVVGSSLADEVRPIQPSGAVRAFDARSGKLLWRFNTIPKPGEFGVDT